jgi:hypothetical protein
VTATAPLCLVPVNVLRGAPDAARPELDRHNRALSAPRGFEWPVVEIWRQLLTAPDRPLHRYAAAAIRRAYSGEYAAVFDGARVEEDYVLGPALAAALAPDGTPAERFRGAAGLLDGPLGRLDGGTLSGLLVTAAERAGVTL